jgi:hypothetical protein
MTFDEISTESRASGRTADRAPFRSPALPKWRATVCKRGNPAVCDEKPGFFEVESGRLGVRGADFWHKIPSCPQIFLKFAEIRELCFYIPRTDWTEEGGFQRDSPENLCFSSKCSRIMREARQSGKNRDNLCR